MVAEAQALSAAPIAPSAKESAKEGNLKRMESKTPARSNPSKNWDIIQELAVRNMYLVQGLSPNEIAKALGKNTNTVYSLVHRRAWNQERRQLLDKAKEKSSVLKEEHISRVVEAQASLAEEASLGALRKAVAIATNPVEGKDDARNYRAWSGGARDLVNVMRIVRRMDAAANAAPTNLSISFFGVGVIGAVSGASNGKADTREKSVAQSESVEITAKEIK